MSGDIAPPEDAAAARKAQRHTETRKRPHVWNMRASDAEDALLRALLREYRGTVQARVYGESKGGFMRYWCLGRGAAPLRKLAAPKISAHPSERELTLLRNDIAGGLNNLNQLTRGLNRNQLPVPDEIYSVIAALEHAAAQINATLNPSMSYGEGDTDASDDHQRPEQG